MGIARLGGQWGRQLAQPTVPAKSSGGRETTGAAPSPTAAAEAPSQPTENFESLTRYIPTETVTLFLAGISAVQAVRPIPERAGQGVDANASAVADGALALAQAGYWGWAVYGLFAVITPVLVWILAYSSYLRARQALPEGSPAPDPFAAPRFRMVAALIAFLIWGLAVPGLLPGPTWHVLAGFGAMVASTFLTVLEPIFERSTRS